MRRGAVDEFAVFHRVDIDHEVAERFANLHHGQRGDGIEHELGGCAGFEPGGTREHFRTGINGDEKVGDAGGKMDVGGIGADQEDGFGALGFGLDEGAVDEGGGAAGGDAEGDVVFGDVEVEDGLGAGLGVVFDGFDGFF